MSYIPSEWHTQMPAAVARKWTAVRSVANLPTKKSTLFTNTTPTVDKTFSVITPMVSTVSLLIFSNPLALAFLLSSPLASLDCSYSEHRVTRDGVCMSYRGFPRHAAACVCPLAEMLSV